MRVYLIIRAKVVPLRRILWAMPEQLRNFINKLIIKYHEKIILTHSNFVPSNRR